MATLEAGYQDPITIYKTSGPQIITEHIETIDHRKKFCSDPIKPSLIV